MSFLESDALLAVIREEDNEYVKGILLQMIPDELQELRRACSHLAVCAGEVQRDMKLGRVPNPLKTS